MNDVIIFFNQNSGAIQAFSTLILVGVTIWYAVSTKKMSDLMKAQITPKIIMENFIIGSCFLEKWFIMEKHYFRLYYRFNIVFDIRNEGNASGSIYKPTLSIIIPKYNIVRKIEPTTKEYEQYNIKSNGFMETSDTRTISYGTSIILKAGEVERVELKYEMLADNDDDLNFIKKIKESPDCLEYKLTTRDNWGKEHDFRILKILEKDEVKIN